MSYLIPPAGSTDEQIEEFISSLREEAQQKVREMLREGAPEDEVIEYLETLDSEDIEPAS